MSDKCSGGGIIWLRAVFNSFSASCCFSDVTVTLTCCCNLMKSLIADWRQPLVSFWNKWSEKSSRDDRLHQLVCTGAYEGLGSLWVIAVATYIQQKCKQKPITYQRSSVIWQKISQTGNALNVVDPIGLTEFKNTPPPPDRLAHCRNAALRQQ